MTRYALQAAARALVPNEKVGACLRRRWRTRVGVQYAPEHRKACYSGLVTCASVWMCPVCCAKISERRRLEIAAGLQAWEQRGGRVQLVTFTVRHKRGDDLVAVREGLLAARSKLLSGKAAQLHGERYGIVGRIRALEVTHGGNGWHPHIHELQFTEGAICAETLADELRQRWSAAVAKVGLREVNSHSIDVAWADFTVADYVAKFGHERTWGPEHEMAKAIAKRGRSGSRTPIALLAAYGFGSDRQAGSLWRQYAQGFKGQRQLHWSHGLRELLGLKREQTDEQVAADVREYSVLLAELEESDWRLILALERAQGYPIRAEVLRVASLGSEEVFRDYLEELRQEAAAGELS